MAKPNVIIAQTKLPLTNKVAREVVTALRKHGRLPKAQDAEPTLSKRLYNVEEGPLHIERPLSNGEINQRIVHLNPPRKKGKKGYAGIPITVQLPDMGLEIETVLVPQWRFGAGMRTSIIGAAMEGKKSYCLVESEGKLVLTFK